jgi:hypothetical protein
MERAVAETGIYARPARHGKPFAPLEMKRPDPLETDRALAITNGRSTA